MNFALILGAWVLGVVIGVLIAHFEKPHGTLRIDHSNPEKDVYRMEFDDLDGLSKKTRVILKVDNNANLSQE